MDEAPARRAQHAPRESARARKATRESAGLTQLRVALSIVHSFYSLET